MIPSSKAMLCFIRNNVYRPMECSLKTKRIASITINNTKNNHLSRTNRYNHYYISSTAVSNDTCSSIRQNLPVVSSFRRNKMSTDATVPSPPTTKLNDKTETETKTNNPDETTKTTTAKVVDSEQDTKEVTDERTFRERLRGHAKDGRAAARKGATSAKAMIQQYGPVFVGTYLTLYGTTLGTLFAGVQSGALDPAVILSYITPEGTEVKSTALMVADLLEKYPWTKPYAHYVEEEPWMANFALAWIATKFTEPIRFGATVIVVPRLARYFGYTEPTQSEKEDSDENSNKVKNNN